MKNQGNLCKQQTFAVVYPKIPAHKRFDIKAWHFIKDLDFAC